MSASCPYSWFDPDPESTHNLVVGLVPPGGEVLEFGCATGHMSAVLKHRLGCRVTGVELSPEAAEAAREHCERVIIGDADSLDLPPVLGDRRFDAVIFADVLEHLREPGALLARIRPLLGEGGVVIASIPNVAHGSVRAALLRGEFRYRPLGLLDRTHLRFFTRDGVQDLFEATGYYVTHWLRRRRDVDATEIRVSLTEEVRTLLANDPEATTYQFVVRAAPAEAARELNELRHTFAETTALCDERGNDLRRAGIEGARLTAEVAALRAELEKAAAPRDEERRLVEEQRQHLDALTASLESAVAWEATLHGRFVSAHRQLLERDEEIIRMRDQVASAQYEADSMRRSKAWRLSLAYWRLRDRLRGR